MKTYKIPEILAYPGAINQLLMVSKRYNAKRVLIFSDLGVSKAGIVDLISDLFKEKQVETLVESSIDKEPSTSFIESITQRLENYDPNLIIAVGGGTPIDAAKAISICLKTKKTVHDFFTPDNCTKKGIPIIAIPTTAGTGSEVTPISVLTDNRDSIKKAIVSPFIIPDTAILDANLTLKMPPHVTAFSGMDALTHAIESYTSPKANDFTKMFSLKAIKLISENLKVVVNEGNNYDARNGMLLGSLYAGIGFSNAGVAAVHALAYPVGGLFDVPHGMANTLLLPYVMEFNLDKCNDTYKIIAEKMLKKSNVSAQDAIEFVKRLALDCGVDDTLKTVGIPENKLAFMAKEACSISRLMDNNPKTISTSEAEMIYKRAYNSRAQI